MIEMDVVYSWSFPKVELSKDPNEGTIASVTYTITASDQVNSVSFTGSVTLPRPKDVFVPYEEVTNEMVSNWIVTRFPDLYDACRVNLSGALARMRDENRPVFVEPHFAQPS